MANENPFSQSYRGEQFQPPQNQNLNPHRSSTTKILLFIFGGLFLACSGLVGLAYFTLQKYVGPASTDLTEVERPTFQSNADAFNNSLLKSLDGNEPATDASIDQGLLAFIQKSLDQSVLGIDIPFNQELFIEAIGQSDAIQSPLSMFDRVILRTWFVQYAPEPDPATEYFRVLAVREDATRRFATADIVYYDTDSQSQSFQWYLAKVDGKWTLYDWQRLEYGLRSSDEYAAYLRGSDKLAEGSVDALTQASDAEEIASQGEVEAAKVILRQAEAIKTLPADEQVTKLRMGYTWMSIGDFKEALRVFQSIRDPNDLWGVWPCIAVCEQSLGNYESALKAAKKAGLQSPNHPNVFELLSETHSVLGDDDLAAASAIKLMRLCPQDPIVVRNVIGFERDEDIGEVLDCLIQAENESLWRSLIVSTSYESDWAQALSKAMTQRQNVPVGAVEIIQGNRAEADEEFDLAAAKFLAANKAETEDYLQEMAHLSHMNLRTEHDQYKQLFGETDDLTALLREMLESAMYDELYSDPQKLLKAINDNSALPKTPYRVGIVAWCHFGLEQYGESRDAFEQTLAQLNETDSNESEGPEQSPDGEDWDLQRANIEYYITECFLYEDQPIAALNRFKDNEEIHDQIVESLLSSNKSEVVDSFVEATQQNEHDHIQLHRQRLLAKRALENGDGKQCDQHHRNALEMAANTYDEEKSYVVRSMIAKRAKSLVWQRTWNPFFADIDFNFEDMDQHSTHAIAFAAESARLLDITSLRHCLTAAQDGQLDSGQIDGDTIATIEWHLASAQKSRGEFAAAAKTMRSSIDAMDPDNDWLVSSRSTELGNLCLEINAFDEARRLLGSDAETVPVDASIALASGDLSLVKELLEKVPKDTAASWLRRSENYKNLQDHGGSPEQRALLSEFPMFLKTYSSASMANLYFDSNDHKIDKDFVSGILTRVSPNKKYELSSISIDTQGNASRQSFVANTESDQILFSWSEDSNYDTKAFPIALRSLLEGTVTRLTISVASERPRATEKVFRLAQSASQNAFAFTWGGNNIVWLGDDLNEQLKWKDRVPTPKKLVRANIFVTPDTTPDNDDSQLSFKQWRQKIDASDSDLAVRISLTVAATTEQLVADVVGVNEKSEMLYVVPRKGSAVDSVVQAGVRYACWPYQVVLP